MNKARFNTIKERLNFLERLFDEKSDEASSELDIEEASAELSDLIAELQMDFSTRSSEKIVQLY